MIKITYAGESYSGDNFKLADGFFNLYSGETLVKSWTAETIDGFYFEPTSSVEMLLSAAISGTIKVGEEISVVPTFTHEVSPTLSYQWYRASSSSAAGSAIDGATDAKYTVAAADAEKYIYCHVVASGSAVGVADTPHKLVPAVEENA